MEITGPKRVGRRLVPVETVTVTVNRAEARPARGIVSNISEFGACLITNIRTHRDTIVRLKLATRTEELFETDARVAWCREGMDRVKEIVGVMIGVSFVNVSADLHQIILQRLDSEIFQEVVPPDAASSDETVLAAGDANRPPRAS